MICKVHSTNILITVKQTFFNFTTDVTENMGFLHILITASTERK